MATKIAITDEQIRKAAAVIVDGDLGKQTLVDYLKSLLETLWEEGENFSGKRPFGNGGWQLHVCKAFVIAKLVDGEIDADDDYLVACDEKAGDALVLAVIRRLVIKG